MKYFAFLCVFLMILAIADRSAALASAVAVALPCSFVLWCVWQGLSVFIRSEPEETPERASHDSLDRKLKALDILGLDPLTRRAAEQKVRREHR